MRILKCGMHEIEKKCSNCGCTFAFDKSEITVDTTGRFYGFDGNPLRFVVCPQCRHAISIN